MTTEPRTDAVLDLIDHTLADSTLGPDAARWAPAKPPTPTRLDPYDLTFEPGPNRYAWVAGAAALYRLLAERREVSDGPR